MQDVVQIIHGKWIITCEPDNKILEDHALVVRQGVIQDILPSHQAKINYSGAQHTECLQHALLPGFINLHTHLGMNFFRGLADDLALMDWLNNHIWPAETKWLSDEFVYDAATFAMAEMIRSGTTCFNDMYFFPEATARATIAAGMRASIGLLIIDVQTAWAKSAEECFAHGQAFIDRYGQHDLITPTIAPHATYTVSEKNLSKAKALADKYHLKIHIHVHETADEIQHSMTNTQQRPLQRLAALGLVSPQMLAVHMTQISAEDCLLLQTLQPHIVHCPESNMKLASGSCPATEFFSLGLNVALGTDSVASNNDLDMLAEMRMASYHAKLITGNPQALSAQEVLKMATINGAKALGLEHKIGSLVKNKAADFIAIDLGQLETLPVYDPVAQIVYSAGRQQVTDVWVAGKQLLRNRHLTTLNEPEIKAKAEFWGKKLRR